jgi:hypothetical protein
MAMAVANVANGSGVGVDGNWSELRRAFAATEFSTIGGRVSTTKGDVAARASFVGRSWR